MQSPTHVGTTFYWEPMVNQQHWVNDITSRAMVFLNLSNGTNNDSCLMGPLCPLVKCYPDVCYHHQYFHSLDPRSGILKRRGEKLECECPDSLWPRKFSTAPDWGLPKLTWGHDFPTVPTHYLPLLSCLTHCAGVDITAVRSAHALSHPTTEPQCLVR